MDNERLVAALLQQELDAAQRPYFGNPNLAAQGRRMNLPARQGPGPFAEFAMQAASLDPQPDQGYGTMAAEMALGFVPGVGQAMAARDIERARRDNDPLGMGMAASSFVPFGKLINALRGRKQMGPVSELITYHGSPHRFPPTKNNPLGEFDPMKIGTGEGAQSYGVGAGYLAESPAVGKTYKVGQRDLIKSVQAQLDAVNTALNVEYRKSGSFDATKDARQLSRRQNNLRKELEEAKQGNLYKVDLPDEQIAKMLDWDKPMSQQAPEVQALIKKAHDLRAKQTGAQFTLDMNVKGGDWLPTIGEGRLKEAGIPGIKYLDQGSRTITQPTYPGGFKISPPNTTVSGKWMVKGDDYNSKGLQFNSEAEAQKHLDKMFPNFVLPKPPQGTSNFVVFDPAHMNIIGRE